MPPAASVCRSWIRHHVPVRPCYSCAGRRLRPDFAATLSGVAGKPAPEGPIMGSHALGPLLCWHARRDSNPQPAVLETAALPIELLAFWMRKNLNTSGVACCHLRRSAPASAEADLTGCYSMILATTPAPTVRPPSRTAKRRPSSIAIGAISVTTILMLSPGMTISTPSGSSTAPVTSVVRK